MSIEDSNVTNEVKDFVAGIVSENGFSKSAKVKYNTGSRPGEGFLSKTYAVDIVDGEQLLQIFLKCPLDFKTSAMTSLYRREILFYETIYPAYIKFMEERSVNSGLSSIPKCFRTSEESAMLALENLKTIGFTLFSRTKCMNDELVELILRTFAKFHAVSFAMKDQQKDAHDAFCAQCTYLYRHLKSFGFEKAFAKVLEDFVSKLNPIEDRDIIDKYQGLGPKVEDVYLNLPDHLSEYSILTKGDCWINNMMILYEDKEEEHPKDLALIDWQCITKASPVYDIAPLFYSGTTKEAMDNYKYYLRVYHKELSDRIRELGSDPEILYPYSVLETEWKGAGLYAICLAMLAIRVLVRDGENDLDFETSMNEGAVEDMFSNVGTNEELWMSRVKHIARHLIDIGSV